MPFSVTHKLSSYLMALAALAALITSGQLHPLTTAFTLGAFAISWFAEYPRYPIDRFATAWNIAALLLLSYLVVGVIGGDSAILAGVHFLLFILVNRLFNRRESKNYQQVYIVSFLMLVAATALNTGLSYAVSLLFYVVFATWSLILLHLRRSIENTQLLQHDRDAAGEQLQLARALKSRRIVGGAFLASTALLSLGVVLVATLLFALFPRIGFGLLGGSRRHGIPMAGFSEQVQLGHHGTIRNNARVVIRVMFGDRKESAPAPPFTLRWRGSVFDHYEAGTWSHAADILGRTATVAAHEQLYLLNHAPGMPLHPTPSHVRTHLLRQEIYLEPIQSSVIFAADRPVAVEAPPVRRGIRTEFAPRRGPLGEIRAAQRHGAGLRYVAYSKLYHPAPALLRRARLLVGDQRLQRFLQLPPELPARIGALARRITAGQPTVYDKVAAVERYLQREYRYTLDLTHERGREPVDEFLFETREGHCEYFASAMTLLLRTLGIHARHVNGFIGGQWNHYGNYLAVRQGDAHAWTEVLFSNVGWLAFDATPPLNRPAATTGGLAQALRQMLDALRLRWFHYVVEYNLEKQVRALTRLRDLLRGPPVGARSRNWLREHRRPLLIGVALVVGSALLAWGLYRRRRRKGRSQSTATTRRRHPASALYGKALAALARAHHPKPPGLTPLEFASRLLDEKHRCAELVEQLTRCYYRARFGPEGWTTAGARQLATLVVQLRSQLTSRSHKSRRTPASN